MSLDDAANAVDIEEALVDVEDEEIGPTADERPSALPDVSAAATVGTAPQRAYAAQMLESIKQEHRGFLHMAKGLKMAAVPMQRCGVSDLFEETTLEALDQEPKDLHALADDVLGLPGTDRNASCPNGKPALFLRQLSGSTTCSSSATQGSSTTTSQGSAKGDTSAPAVAPLDSAPTAPSAASGQAGEGIVVPPAANPAAPSPLLATRSKGEALVHAALFSFSVGVHQDHGGSSFMEDTSTVLQTSQKSVDGPNGSGGTPLPLLALVGVFDGHGGAEAAQYLKGHLAGCVARQLGIGASRDALHHAWPAACAPSSASSASFASSGSSASTVSATSPDFGPSLTSASPLEQEGALCSSTFSSTISTTAAAAAQREYGFDDEAARRALVRGFAACEQELVSNQCRAGATAAVLLLQNGGHCLNVAWVGDCRAVLCRAGTTVRLTRDHTPKSSSERARVLREGGTLSGGRLNGCLSVTRAFGNVESEEQPTGDMMMMQPPPLPGRDVAAAAREPAAAASSKPGSGQPRKCAGLTAAPEVMSEPLSSDDEFVILASDGLWDVVSSERAVSLVRAELRAYQDAQMAAERLVEEALKNRCDDNVTVTVVPLFPPRTEQRSKQNAGFGLPRQSSFVHLNTPSSFVRVVGGFQ